jgi:hypothetical protein
MRSKRFQHRSTFSWEIQYLKASWASLYVVADNGSRLVTIRWVMSIHLRSTEDKDFLDEDSDCLVEEDELKQHRAERCRILLTLAADDAEAAADDEVDQ